MNQFTRRGFLTYLGLGTYEMLRSSPVFSGPKKAVLKKKPFFSPIASSSEDKLILPRGFSYERLISLGDSVNPNGPQGLEFFGDDCDYLALVPLSQSEAMLWVNHEAINSVFLNLELKDGKVTREQIRKEKSMVGGSFIRLKHEKMMWSVSRNQSLNRRFTASYPQFMVTGPVASTKSFMTGTLANCGGGMTLWKTVLSCEESYHKFNPVITSDGEQGYAWSEIPEEAIDETDFGWVIEVDPLSELPPAKHTALGRFTHENVCLQVGKSGKLVAYMGDDAIDQCFYKFVSSRKWLSKDERHLQRQCLSEGTLYVADFANGKWLSLDFEKNPKLKERGFKNQADVVLRTRDAAKAVGATPLDRPEDCEIHPKDGSIYLACTNNKKHGNHHGQILRILEKSDDAEGESFRYEIFLAGGTASGLSCPDNLAFDKDANLWVACDISSGALNQGVQKSFGNNGLFMAPTTGKEMGIAYQFASAPSEAEFTGPFFSPDEKSLFLSVQHPGEATKDSRKPTSHWPFGKQPLSSVVVITGF